MSSFVAIAVSWLLPLIVLVALLMLLKRIADGIDRLEATLDRRLLRIQQAVSLGGGTEVETRWPPEE